MPKAKNPLFPTKIDAQVADLNTKLNYLQTNATRLAIPSTELSGLDTLVTDVNTAQAAAGNLDMRSKIDVAVRDEAIQKAQTAMRKVIDFYVADSPNATAVDYEALSIPRPGPHSPLPPPDRVPGIGHITSSDLAVFVPFFDGLTGKHGKPPGVQAIEVYYQLGGDPPASITVMSERVVATASPVHIQFGFDEELKILYLVFRWIGTRGDYGPWSEIHKISIAR